MQCIEVKDSTIMWSADESLPDDQPGLPVGIVSLFNKDSMVALPIKVYLFHYFLFIRI